MFKSEVKKSAEIAVFLSTIINLQLDGPIKLRLILLNEILVFRNDLPCLFWLRKVVLYIQIIQRHISIQCYEFQFSMTC